MAKKLYILISDGGDGSYSPRYTMNPELIKKLQAAADEDRMTYENGVGVDGDGFHYSSVLLPDECTPESLKITVLPDDYADQFAAEDDEGEEPDA